MKKQPRFVLIFKTNWLVCNLPQNNISNVKLQYIRLGLLTTRSALNHVSQGITQECHQ